MGALDDLDRFHAETRAQWRAWLAEHHAGAPGVWLVRWKKATGRPAPSHGEVVIEALCFGWVDSLVRKLDEERAMLLVTPRKRGSNWSKINKEHVETALREGIMTPAGLALVEAAQADGSWTALDDVENLVVPDDLAAAFAARPGAREHWDGFSRSVRRGILEWILNAKRPETRARRVAETADRAQAGEKANQWRGA